MGCQGLDSYGLDLHGRKCLPYCTPDPQNGDSFKASNLREGTAINTSPPNVSDKSEMVLGLKKLVSFLRNLLCHVKSHHHFQTAKPMDMSELTERITDKENR